MAFACLTPPLVVAAIQPRPEIAHSSQGGLKLKGDPSLEHGCDLSVTLPGLPPQPAALRWRADGHLGVSFNRLVPLAELVAWLQGVRDSLRAALRNRAGWR